MAAIQKIFLRCITSEEGASLVEYALLVGLIAVVCIGAIGFFGTSLGSSFSRSGSSIVGG